MDKQKKNGVITALGATERSASERSEPAHSAVAPNTGGEKMPGPEVQPRAQRRRFTAADKQRILAEADAATSKGSIGALLRREGLYSSHLTHWRQERNAALEQGLTPRIRGPKPRIDPAAKELQQLRRQNERLTEQLRKAEIIVDVQKKVATLLGITLAKPDPEDLR